MRRRLKYSERLFERAEEVLPQSVVPDRGAPGLEIFGAATFANKFETTWQAYALKSLTHLCQSHRIVTLVLALVTGEVCVKSKGRARYYAFCCFHRFAR